MNQQAEGDYPAVVYQQIVQNEEGGASVDAPAQKIEMTHTAENQAIIDNATKWVFCLIIVQMLASIPDWGTGIFGIAFPYWNLFMAIIGWIGVRRQHLGLIVAHFLYSMLCLFGLVLVFSLFVFNTPTNEYWPWLFILAGTILASSVLLRQQRFLIQALCAKKVPVGDAEDPMVVELPSETPATAFGAPPSAPAMVVEQPFAAPSFYPVYDYHQDQQPIPMIVQTEMGSQVVYMYPVMPNPQFAPSPTFTDLPQQQQEPPKDTQQQ